MIQLIIAVTPKLFINKAKGTCLYFSVIGGKDQVVLPLGGSIVFAGDAGTKFEISAQ